MEAKRFDELIEAVKRGAKPAITGDTITASQLKEIENKLSKQIAKQTTTISIAQSEIDSINDWHNNYLMRRISDEQFNLTYK